MVGNDVHRSEADPIQRRPSEVPWRQIAGARDILIHEYFRVDENLTWEMVQVNLPELKKQIQGIVGEE